MKRPFNKYSVPLTILSAAVIGILLFGSFVHQTAENTRDSRVYVDLRELAKDVDAYREATGCYPTTEEGLGALVSRPPSAPAKWKQIIKKVPFDAWGNDYRYRLVNREGREVPEVYSCGRDCLPDTVDDLSSLD
jgi:general secretion pathway protein G